LGINVINIKKSRIIEASPEAIWQFINQVERYPEWMPGVIASEVVTEPAVEGSQVGRKQKLKIRLDIGEGESTQEVISWEPPTRITWQHINDVVGGKKIDYAREIKTTMSITNENGKVSFRMVGSWLPSGISGKLMSRIMKRSVEKNFEKAFDNLQKILENEH
jgi:carbon monoxide dehydrogenase subunit G